MAELTRLGRYQLKRVLGRGAMGVVYEGHDPTLNRRVAIKTILRNAAIDEETARHYSAQFAREAQAAGRLNHPNIVQVHDFAEEGDVAYLVMEFIQGRELRAFFDAKERFEPAEVVRIMGELLDALDFAHESGVIHRDVKPANVMVDAQRRVKLADFGVARIQESERSAAGTMVGTPAFMSPEQIQGLKIDRRTDIFSAGVVLYQLLTGEQPFTGQGAWTVAKKIMQDDPPRPSTVVTSVSPVFDEIVNKALAKNPAQRYASAKEFAAALRGTLAPAPAQQTVPPATPAMTTLPPKSAASEAEVEFWRSIQNSTDPDELEFYLEQFPEGTYAPLARHKIAKLREPLEAAQKEKEAAESARKEAEAKRAAEAAAAKEKARREAEAQEKARKEAEEKQRHAQALARLKAQEEAAARAKAVPDPEATVAISRPAPKPAAPKQAAATPPRPPTAPARKSLAAPIGIAAAVIVAGIAAYFMLGRSPAPAPVAVAPPAPKVEPPGPAVAPPAPPAPAVDVEKIRRETEERVRKEYADKSAAEQKAAAEKAVQEKLAAAKAEKAAADKAAAEKAQAEKAAAAKAAQEKAAADKAAAEKAQAEKAAAERAAAEKAAAEKAAAEKAAAARAAPARKPGWPAVGDKYAYEARDVQSGARHQVSVEITGVAPEGISERYRVEGGPDFTQLYKPGAFMRGAGMGIGLFSPFLHVLQELKPGMTWSNIPFERFGNCSNNVALTCVLSGKVVGRERVTVKAGTFNAWRVELQNEGSMAGGGSSSGDLTYWYAEEVGRLVKYESRVRRGRGPPPTDMELLSYQPAK